MFRSAFVLLLLLQSYLFGAVAESEFREWTLQNGTQSTLKLVNAYGSMAYFVDEDGGMTRCPLMHLVPSDRAIAVHWSRERDASWGESSPELSEFSERFRKDAYRLNGKKLESFDWEGVEEAEFYAIYTSASWCGPCKKFTPRLRERYTILKNIYGDRFELILCSWDKSKGAMIKYMQKSEMTWFGNWRARNDKFWRRYQGSGIPCLVIVDRNGYVLSHSYDADGYNGPMEPLNDLTGMLGATHSQETTRLSVSTPGVDSSKVDSIIRERRKSAKSKKEELSPIALYTPLDSLEELLDSAEEETTLKVRVEICENGVVRSAELIGVSNPVFEERIESTLMLWQFAPKVMENGKNVSTEFVLPLKLNWDTRLLEDAEV